MDVDDDVCIPINVSSVWNGAFMLSLSMQPFVIAIVLVVTNSTFGLGSIFTLHSLIA